MSRFNLLLLPFFSFLSFSFLYSQESNVATGGDIQGAEGSVNYSIGQVVFSTNIGANGSEAQGVQQPYEIWITGTADVPGVTLEIVAYPNPTQGELWLTIDDYSEPNLKFELYDFTGKLLKSGLIIEPKTKIEMHQYAVATYLLRVSNKKSLIQTFKIIKN